MDGVKVLWCQSHQWLVLRVLSLHELVFIQKNFCDLFIYCPLWPVIVFCRTIRQFTHQPVDVICIPAETTLSAGATISTGAAVGITAVVVGTIALIIGVLAGVLVYHCINKHRFQSSKPETSSHQQQQAAVPQQRAGPEYEEVVELKDNTAYVPAQSIELKPCEAYVPVQH